MKEVEQPSNLEDEMLKLEANWITVNATIIAIQKPYIARMVQRASNVGGLKSREPARMPMLTQKMSPNRLLCCQQYANWTVDDWKRVLFSDEAKFNYLPGGHIVSDHGDQYSAGKTLSIIKHSLYMMIWGCIKFAGVQLIIFFRSSMTIIKYIDIINSGLVPTAEEVLGDYIDVIFFKTILPLAIQAGL